MSKNANLQNLEKSPWVQENFRKNKKGNRKTHSWSFYNFFENLVIQQNQNLKLKAKPNGSGPTQSRNSNSNDWTPENSNANRVVRSRCNRLINFNQLPVIKEEEGVSDQEEVELRNFLLPDPAPASKNQNRKTLNGSSNNKFKKIESAVEEAVESLTFFTPSDKKDYTVNINCMMNAEVKQSNAIWDTNFGKRLINGKPSKESTLSEAEEFNFADKIPLEGIERNQKFGDGQSVSEDESFMENKMPIPICNSKKGTGDTQEIFISKIPKSKPQKVKKECRKSRAKANKTDVNHPDVKIISEGHEVVSTIIKEEGSECQEYKETLLTTSEEFQDFAEPTTTPSYTKNQRFLTECIRSILDNDSTQTICEFCEETCKNPKELLDHEKRHAAEKQTCLLCDEVFYHGIDFTRHLLTHEGVDTFSCKKCKKYFPSLKKYKQHYKDVHLKSSVMSATNCKESEDSAEVLKKWLPKYECSRCNQQFDLEETRRAHKRNHIKKDLNAAYLLCPDNL